ncbi:glycine zipper 2TM domain-containing protein [Erythrobacter sp. SG61-1L]|uniref:glycine zipper 2TM domain-containing protein n=1 Tax=Erythrobacter sp. SG61-1L TaxID=1603897 RepID=UPI0006C930FA|nr:glycine zipper 2TM domain-containing protein [Erythrobacter sp. SG61-1L]
MRHSRPILLAVITGAAFASAPVQAGEPYTLPQLDVPAGVPDAAFDAAIENQGTWGGEWEAVHTGAPRMVPMGAMPYSGPTGMPGYPMMHPGAGLPPQPAAVRLAYSAEERENWLHECRKRYGDSDNGLGGALIGGVLGGVAGNVIAGKGNRTLGTVIGATTGAIAGAAIDKGEDRGKARDFCEDYLARYEASGTQGAYSSYGYAAGGNVMWVPTVVGWKCKPKEEVVEEWVEEKPARRVIPKKTKYVPVKTKTVPVKTVPVKAKSVKAIK